MDKIIIKQKRSSFALLILGTVALMVSSIVVFITNDSLFYKIAGVVGVIFFGIGLVMFIMNFLNPKEILVIDKNGINVNSQGSNLGFIPWDDIESFSIDKITLGNRGRVNHSLISINLVDEEKYLEKTSGIQRKIMDANRKLNYSTTCINLTGAEKKMGEVKEILDEYLNKYMN